MSTTGSSVGSRGFDRNRLINFNLFSVAPVQEGEAVTEGACVICMQEWEARPDLLNQRVRYGCGHVFHRMCAEGMEMAVAPTLCPTCRFDQAEAYPPRRRPRGPNERSEARARVPNHYVARLPERLHLIPDNLLDELFAQNTRDMELATREGAVAMAAHNQATLVGERLRRRVEMAANNAIDRINHPNAEGVQEAPGSHQGDNNFVEYYDEPAGPAAFEEYYQAPIGPDVEFVEYYSGPVGPEDEPEETFYDYVSWIFGGGEPDHRVYDDGPVLIPISREEQIDPTRPLVLPYPVHPWEARVVLRYMPYVWVFYLCVLVLFFYNQLQYAVDRKLYRCENGLDRVLWDVDRDCPFDS